MRHRDAYLLTYSFPCVTSLLQPVPALHRQIHFFAIRHNRSHSRHGGSHCWAALPRILTKATLLTHFTSFPQSTEKRNKLFNSKTTCKTCHSAGCEICFLGRGNTHVSRHKSCILYYIAVWHNSIATDGIILVGAGECYDEPDLKQKFSNNAYLLSSSGKCLCDSQTHTTSNTHSTREEINSSSSKIYFNISKIYELTFDHIWGK